MGWMLKLVVFAVGFIVVTYWIRTLFSGTRGERQGRVDTPNKMPRQRRAQTSQQTITCCNYCGVFVPQSEIVHGRAGDYCSKEHRERKEGQS